MGPIFPFTRERSAARKLLETANTIEAIQEGRTTSPLKNWQVGRRAIKQKYENA